jgi:hypothetical protein
MNLLRTVCLTGQCPHLHGARHVDHNFCNALSTSSSSIHLGNQQTRKCFSENKFYKHVLEITLIAVSGGMLYAAIELPGPAPDNPSIRSCSQMARG